MTNKDLQTYQCKEEGCNESVQYMPMILFGAMPGATQTRKEAKVVYLTCSKGHTHSYLVHK